MIDINLIREKPEWVKQQYQRRHDEGAFARIDLILELDRRRRTLLHESEGLQAERKKLNQAMGRFRGNKNLTPGAMAAAAMETVRAITAQDYAGALEMLSNPPNTGEGDKEAALNALTESMRLIGERVEELTKLAERVDADLRDNLLWLPNICDERVPEGESSEQNIIYPAEGTPRQFDFTPKPHWELGPALDVIDFERGVKLSGTRFYILKGMGARLQRALINFCLDFHAQRGFTEFYLPFLVKDAMMEGSGQFPKFRNDVFQDRDAELYLLPTAEVGLTNVHREEILEADQLPLNYVANTPCWRREAASAGRDVRGIKRVHQFQKVEMYKIVAPENSAAELETLVNAASDICRALKIPFRKVALCAGDTGFGMAQTFDLEMWSPGCGEWLEVSSCSNAKDFQARRAALKYRPTPGAKAEFLHTLNGSGLAMPRVIIAILENYQQSDGSVVVPEVLRPYLGGLDVIRR